MNVSNKRVLPVRRSEPDTAAAGVRSRGIALVAFAALAVLAAGCSSSDDTNAGSKTGTKDRSTTSSADSKGGDSGPDALAVTIKRTDGPSATVDGELTTGKGVFLAQTTALDLAAAGYDEHEYAVKGTATGYRPVGDDPASSLPASGEYKLEPTPGASGEYVTRIVVRRPTNPADFNGTVLVEWLNVSGGLDANPDFAYTGDEIVRGGYAWVGMSVQRIGVEGGPVAVSIPMAGGLAGKGLKALDPERYGKLSHPGDQYAYDMYTQVARLLRSQSVDDSDGPLGGLTVGRLLAVGESQSAFALTTYVNGIQPLAGQFDGFFIHSRGAGGLPIAPAQGSDMDIAGSISGTPTKIRTDQPAPVLVFETESDVLGIINYHPATQPDSDTFRLWEVAGTAHADGYLLGSLADQVGCKGRVNRGPQHFVAKAGLRALDTWVRTGTAPAKADRLGVTDGAEPAFQRTADGLVEGGIRLPQVAVPTEVNSGEPTPEPSVICMLMGSSTDLPAARLSALYPSKADYTAKYEAAADKAIDQGFALPEDRDALLADAQPDKIG